MVEGPTSISWPPYRPEKNKICIKPNVYATKIIYKKEKRNRGNLIRKELGVLHNDPCWLLPETPADQLGL